jgi:hypothetical protein
VSWDPADFAGRRVLAVQLTVVLVLFLSDVIVDSVEIATGVENLEVVGVGKLASYPSFFRFKRKRAQWISCIVCLWNVVCAAKIFSMTAIL